MTRLKVLFACVSVSVLAACAQTPNEIRVRGPIALGSPLFDTQGYSGGSYACINLHTWDAARIWPQVPVGGWVKIIG